MRVIVLLHGMAAALTIASLLHLIVLLPRRPVAPRGAALGFLLCMLALHVLGWWAYPEFRTEIRFDLIRDDSRQWLANLFDVKEFLSVGALAASFPLTVSCLPRRRMDARLRRPLLVASWFILVVLVVNTVVGLVLANHQIL